jgi:hypothetical protein
MLPSSFAAAPLVAIGFVVASLSAGRAISPQSRDMASDTLAARHLDAGASVNMSVPAGSVRLIGWAHDSFVVRGHVPSGEKLFVGGSPRGYKLIIEDLVVRAPSRPCDLVVYLPASSTASLRTASADITGSDVSGLFTTVSGHVTLGGAARSIEVEDMNGDVDLDVATPWIRVRTGDGHLIVRGAPQDIDASTVAGAMDVASPAIVRGQFGSVSGDIRYAGAPAAGGIFEFSNHSGSVELLLARTVSGVFTLSSIVGSIENGFGGVRPAASDPHSLRITLGRGESQVAVRTYRGTIRLRSQ